MVIPQHGTLVPNQLSFNIKIALKLRLDSKKRFKWSEIFLKIYYVLPDMNNSEIGNGFSFYCFVQTFKKKYKTAPVSL